MNFYDVYRLTYPDGNRVVAVGLVETKNHTGICYLVPGGIPRSYAGKILKDSTDKVEFAAEAGKLVFERLTVQRFGEMADDILGFGALEPQLRSNEAINLFYTENFLPQYWVERYENGQRMELSEGH